MSSFLQKLKGKGVGVTDDHTAEPVHTQKSDVPSGVTQLPVDVQNLLSSKAIKSEDLSMLESPMKWVVKTRGGGKNTYLQKQDYLILNLMQNIAKDGWKRPIYFAVTTGSEAYLGLEEYFQLEGLAYRLVPIRQTPSEAAMGGRVNTEVMYDNLMNKFFWGGMDKKGVNLDENCVRMSGNLRMQMGILAGALINEGKNKKAKEVLDKCLKVMPDENIPYDATIFTICAAYYEVGDTKTANELAKKLFDIFAGDLRIYNAQKPNRRNAYARDVNQAKEILKRVTSLTQQFKQDAVYKEFMGKLNGLLSPEDFEPAERTPQMP